MIDDVIPIAKPDLPELKVIEPELAQMLQTGMITNHTFVKRFEKAIADYLGVKYVVCVANGTSALILAARALDLSGEVIIPSFTFSASAHAMSWCGLKLVFVDIDKETFNIDVSKIEDKITQKTSAIVPINVFGNPCKINALQDVANDNKLRILYDSAHAFGTSYKNRKVGCFGDAEIFSLTPTKILTAAEGGVVTTNNEKVYKRVLLDREYGKTPDYDCKTIGLSARMGEFNAILGFHNLTRLDDAIKRRSEIYQLYKLQLQNVEGISFQKLNENAKCSMKDFAIIVDEGKFGLNRDQLADSLNKKNISFRKYFYPPVHKESVYKKIEKQKYNLPNTDYVADNILNLPFFTSLVDNTVIKICDTIKQIKRNSKQ